MAYSDRKTIDMDDTKHCTPCKTRDKKTKAEYYCTDCEAYYCEECFEIHPRVPYLAKHIVLKHDDIDVWSRDQYKCSTHGKNLEFFCKEHKMLCCHVCISLKHRSCTDMEYISESAMQSDLEDHIKKMNEKIEDQLQMIESHTYGISKKAVTNQSSKTEYIKELESFRSRIKAMFDSLIEKAFEELNERFDDNTKYADNSNEKLVRFKSRLNDLQQQLKSTTVGKEVLVYISLKKGENLIEEISKELSNIDLSTDNDHYKPVIDEKIEKYVKDLQKIAFLEDEKMRQECVAREDCRKEDFKEIDTDIEFGLASYPLDTIEEPPRDIEDIIEEPPRDIEDIIEEPPRDIEDTIEEPPRDIEEIDTDIEFGLASYRLDIIEEPPRDIEDIIEEPPRDIEDTIEEPPRDIEEIETGIEPGLATFSLDNLDIEEHPRYFEGENPFTSGYQKFDEFDCTEYELKYENKASNVADYETVPEF